LIKGIEALANISQNESALFCGRDFEKGIS
jgi:hypothetical protein